jgi:hypothetical protein
MVILQSSYVNEWSSSKRKRKLSLFSILGLDVPVSGNKYLVRLQLLAIFTHSLALIEVSYIGQSSEKWRLYFLFIQRQLMRSPTLDRMIVAVAILPGNQFHLGALSVRYRGKKYSFLINGSTPL